MHTFRHLSALRFARYCLVVGTVSSVAVFSFGGQVAWADAACTPPNNGPIGPDAGTFTYQCDGTYAGDWTSSYYLYNPSTGVQTPLYGPDYSYDCATNTWTETEWDYDAASDTYIDNRVPTTTPAGQATDCANTQDASTTNADASSGNATTAAPIPDTSNPSTATTSGPAATAPPDPNTTCPIPDTSAPDSTANNSVNMDNSVCSQSQSGDASVTNNGTAGNATSGNASTEVDVTNLVQSLSDVLGSGATTFTVTIDQTINRNFVLDPSTIMASAGSDSQPSGTTSVETTDDATINNNIDATATSGDATVSGNGEGGNALSGDAEAIVNLVNIINSAVAAGHSFIGTINITGDLNGNILIPQSVIDQILASNVSAAGGSASTSTETSNESITNNVDASATSGDASVTNNGTAGNATSGNASTKVTIMNLTGSSIVGQNVLLVFVNVLGHWIGMIVNAPAGATSAEFGGGVTSDTLGNNASTVEASTNLSITNNVDASATSGDASVENNGVGGNATSGDANTAVNILNVEDSTLSLANWFGILFINVFGTWNGNFGILPTPTTTSNPVSAGSNETDGTAQTAVAHPATHFATFMSAPNDAPSPLGAAANTNESSAILGDSIVTPTAKKLQDSTLSTTDSGTHANYLLPVIGFFASSLLIVTSERDRLFRRIKK